MPHAPRDAHPLTPGVGAVRPHAPRRFALAVVLVILAIWGGSAVGVVAFGMYDAVRFVDPPADAIVVLGAAQYAGRPSPVLRARLDHAIDLWRQHVAPALVLTGGTGTGDTTSEAAVGAAYARKRGVPDTAIVLEVVGRTTSESMHAVAALLHARGMRSVVLVSDPFHMFRLWILAHRVGLDPSTSPTRTSPIAANVTANAGYIFSESLKAPAVFLFERE